MSYGSMNQLYDYVLGIQEQQQLMKILQKNAFVLVQSILANLEAQLINFGLNNLYGSIPMAQIWQNPSFDLNQFLNMYWQQDEKIKAIINKGVLTPYIPVQIKISLEKILKEYSMLEIVGTEGYQMLKKFSKKKF